MQHRPHPTRQVRLSKGTWNKWRSPSKREMRRARNWRYHLPWYWAIPYGVWCLVKGWLIGWAIVLTAIFTLL